MTHEENDPLLQKVNEEQGVEVERDGIDSSDLRHPEEKAGLLSKLTFSYLFEILMVLSLVSTIFCVEIDLSNT